MTGILNLMYAFGLRRRFRPGNAAVAGPALIALYGCFLIVDGLFPTDPANGFPVGTTTPVHPSGHAVIHALGGLFTFISLTAALAVFARRFRRSWLGYYCAASTVLMIVFFFGSFRSAAFMARLLRLATLVGWMAASVVAIRLAGGDDACSLKKALIKR